MNDAISKVAPPPHCTYYITSTLVIPFGILDLNKGFQLSCRVLGLKQISVLSGYPDNKLLSG